jgi:dTDP-4-dehydrorhamnose 3,5-epimerase
MIEGVAIRSIEVHTDHRGSFAEVYSDRWGLPISPRQWSLVRSSAGTLRGMHFHLRHDEYLLPVSGRCFVGLYDLRPDSPTLGRSDMVELDGGHPKCIAFPRGVVHGWYFPADSLHLQGVSEPYSEYRGDDNRGCHYADPELGLDWPGRPTLLSAEAMGFPSLAMLRAHVSELWRQEFAGA